MSKLKLKEKVLIWYDHVFNYDEALFEQPNFWDEFFLLRPKYEPLKEKVLATTSEKKKCIQLLVDQCIDKIENGSTIQCANGLQTISILIYSVGQKFKPEHCLEFLDYLFNFDQSDVKIAKLAQCIIDAIETRAPSLIKELGLSVLVCCICVRDILEQNPLSTRLLSSPIPTEIIHFFSDFNWIYIYGNRLVTSFALFLSMRNNNNPSLQCLSCLDSALALDGIGSLIENELKLLIEKCLADYAEKEQEKSENSPWFTSYVSSIFVSDPPVYNIEVGNSSLLSLFYTIKMNRNFIPVLTQWRARDGTMNTNDGTNEMGSSGSPPLATFLEYLSLLQQDMKDESKRTSTLLAFSILTLIAEDQYANTFIHDSSVQFRLRLHRAPLRHRPIKSQDINTIPASTFAAWILELCSEFIISHLMKSFPIDVHILSLGIIHRLLIYQKRTKCRLNYDWRSLWETLIHLLRFIGSNENSLLRQFSAQKLNKVILSALIIINVFITHGDIILQTTTKYDELYYELIRLKSVFIQIENYVEKSLKNDTDTEGSRQLYALMQNIRAIQDHFSPIIIGGLNETEILLIIQSNYDDLKLRILDGLDNFDKIQVRYLNDLIFDIVKNIVIQSRDLIMFEAIDFKKLTEKTACS